VQVEPPDVNNPGDPRNKDRTRETQRQMRRILMDWDPIGVASIPQASDEYDCMISPLMRQLYEGADEGSIRSWIVGEVQGHFGMRSVSEREARLARNLVNWWPGRTTET
jgi:hypothetical protein